MRELAAMPYYEKGWAPIHRLYGGIMFNAVHISDAGTLKSMGSHP